MDATIIRCFVVPAMMFYSGKMTWWAPSWIDKAAKVLVPDESKITEEVMNTFPASPAIDSNDKVDGPSGNPIHDSVGSSSDWEKI